MPEAVQREIIGLLDKWGRRIAARMKSRAPRRTGATIGALNYKVYPRTLKMQVGLLGSKKKRRELFYARIMDLGRKAQTKRVIRGRAAGGKVSSYTLNVGPIRATRFVTGPLTDLMGGLRKELKDVYHRALARVAGGGDD